MSRRRRSTPAPAAWVPMGRRESSAVLGLLALLALQLFLAVRGDGMTVDEMPGIGSGYRYLLFSDYRLMPEHPPLSKLLAAIPLAFLDLRVPEAPQGDAQIPWSDDFIHSANRDTPIVAWARLPVVLLTIGLAVFVWRIARDLHGPVAGLVALALVSFHPSLLAHGHLASTDLVSAFTFLLASWAFFRWSRSPTPGAAAFVAVSVGLAVNTRFTGWLLLPAFALLSIPWLWSRRYPPSRWAVLIVAGILLVPLVTWTLYGFHYLPAPGSTCAQPISPDLGLPGRIFAELQHRRLLPEAYLEGLRYQLEHTRGGHWGYFLGESVSEGHWAYYLVAVALKNTPGFLVALGLALVALYRGFRESPGSSPLLHWAVPAAVVFVTASLTRIQLGERYVLAIYPYLILLAAAAVPSLLSKRFGVAILGAVLALHAVPAMLVAPRGYLTYFNAFAGGPEGGHRFLADSNIDWGQDLPRLASWMRHEGVSRIQLGYFGADDPDRYGIEHEDLPTFFPNRPQRPAAHPFRGTIAVSANLMVGFLFPRESDPYAFLRGRTPDARVGVFFIYRLSPGNACRV